MGLEDVIPDDVEVTPGNSRSSKSQENVISIGGGSYEKRFKEEKWERVKKVILDNFDYVSVGEVKSLPPKERFNVLHEAALIDEGNQNARESEYYSEERCYVCDKAQGEAMVEIEGELFCVNHPAGMIRSNLDNEDN